MRLICEPRPAGMHPNAAAACADLERAGGDLDGLPGRPRPCTREYDPVTATATGTYGGRPISWQRTFSNACVLESETGPVFSF